MPLTCSHCAKELGEKLVTVPYKSIEDAVARESALIAKVMALEHQLATSRPAPPFPAGITKFQLG